MSEVESTSLMVWNENASNGCHRLLMELTWRVSDSCVIEAVFSNQDPNRPAVHWDFGRDLLCMGLMRPAGDGDVRVRPHGESSFALTISTGTGTATVIGSRDRLRTFLNRTYQRVPIGREFAWCDWDATVRDWEQAA